MTQPKLNAGQRGEVDASCSIVPANVSPWFMCTNYFPLYKVLMSTLLPIYIQICFLLYVFAKTKSAIISLRHDDVKMKWFWSRLLKQNEKNGYSDTRLCPEISIQTSWHCYEFTTPPPPLISIIYWRIVILFLSATELNCILHKLLVMLYFVISVQQVDLCF